MIMMKKFMIFGLSGWCIEIIFTGICSLLAGDMALTAKTYLWMFPIYGAVGFVLPLFLSMRQYCPLWQRIGFYIFAIFLTEFLTGWLLQTVTGVCPWDYSGKQFAVMGFIRLDYAPLWAVLGLFFEQMALFLAEEGEV